MPSRVHASYDFTTWPLVAASAWIALKDPAEANGLSLFWAFATRQSQSEAVRLRSDAILSGWGRLLEGLKGGRLTATSQQSPRGIDPTFWQRAKRLTDVHDGAVFDYFETAPDNPRQPFFKERHDSVVVNAAEVKAIWPHPAEGFVSVWDYSIDKCDGQIDRVERMVVGILASIWRREIRADQLYLRYFVGSSNVAWHSEEPLSLRALAEIATGRKLDTEEFLDATTRELGNWGIDQYKTAAVKPGVEAHYFELYFYRDIRVLGVSRQQNTGICAPLVVLDHWLESGNLPGHAETDSVAFAKTNSGRAAMPVFTRPADKIVWDSVTEILAIDPTQNFETLCREEAKRVHVWPSDIDEQSRMMDRLKKRRSRARK